MTTEQTSFTTDAMGRFLCSTWAEATGNGGPPFDVVVLGAGMYGAYLAAKLRDVQPGKRVLLLDAGSFLLPEHLQNISSVPLAIPGPMNPDRDNGAARDEVWGIPWRGNVDFPGLAYCLGGRSIYWGGWCPLPDPADLAGWPRSTRESLAAEFGAVRTEIGVDTTADFLNGALQDGLEQTLKGVAPGLAGLAAGTVLAAPLAVQGEPPAPGLFGFDKYSSVPILMEAVQSDRRAAHSVDAYRKLFVVPQAHVVDVVHAGGVVTALDVSVAGRRNRLAVGPGCKVVLAMGAIETTRVAMNSFRTPGMGRNLMAHVRSNFVIRVRRSAIPGALETATQTAAALVTGVAPHGRFHLQITASTSAGGADAVLFRTVPDLDQVEALRSAVDQDWVGLTIRAVGQMHGDRNATLGDPDASWIDVRPDRPDEYGVPRAYVNLAVGEQDLDTWRFMDAAVAALAAGLGGRRGDVQYKYRIHDEDRDDSWTDDPWPLDRSYPQWHDGLGTTHHEAGTLWMGDDPATSVTGPDGRFHHLANAYAGDQSVFPVVGSANPALTGLALARRLARLL
jgi:choline dehydrogenase-like flavoprotein